MTDKKMDDKKIGVDVLSHYLFVIHLFVIPDSNKQLAHRLAQVRDRHGAVA